MTLQEADIFLPRLREIFRECGVAFVILPHLKSSGINGAVRWINKEKVMLALNDRGLWADKFWFSLFHEIKHIFQQKTIFSRLYNIVKEVTNISINKIELEKEADLFAKNYLIPEKLYVKFASRNDFSYSSIVNFSEKIGVDVGIVIGRLQFENVIGYDQFNNSKKQYRII